MDGEAREAPCLPEYISGALCLHRAARRGWYSTGAVSHSAGSRRTDIGSVLDMCQDSTCRATVKSARRAHHLYPRCLSYWPRKRHLLPLHKYDRGQIESPADCRRAINICGLHKHTSKVRQQRQCSMSLINASMRMRTARQEKSETLQQPVHEVHPFCTTGEDLGCSLEEQVLLTLLFYASFSTPRLRITFGSGRSFSVPTHVARSRTLSHISDFCYMASVADRALSPKHPVA